METTKKSFLVFHDIEKIMIQSGWNTHTEIERASSRNNCLTNLLFYQNRYGRRAAGADFRETGGQVRSGFGASATKTSSPPASQKSGAGSPEPLNVLF
ncbi:hypothetical protein [Domibacillus enclensis]|uniref:Uncharacterized protein n=2 Tax=Domibacillus enclensis TaxID=1017273 RepID=A0A1N6NAY2_9BACI|nr:hypothetical protein [Domibacillus enclensis]OXS79988.1 hypothetical protein B1B05_00430 [Domibacillus enclensis]SIP89270.1 hypothetical protein SAMN05443094_10186 [Domibacillus enclensis]